MPRGRGKAECSALGGEHRLGVGILPARWPATAEGLTPEPPADRTPSSAPFHQHQAWKTGGRPWREPAGRPSDHGIAPRGSLRGSGSTYHVQSPSGPLGRPKGKRRPWGLPGPGAEAVVFMPLLSAPGPRVPVLTGARPVVLTISVVTAATQPACVASPHHQGGGNLCFSHRGSEGPAICSRAPANAGPAQVCLPAKPGFRLPLARCLCSLRRGSPRAVAEGQAEPSSWGRGRLPQPSLPRTLGKGLSRWASPWQPLTCPSSAASTGRRSEHPASIPRRPLGFLKSLQVCPAPRG